MNRIRHPEPEHRRDPVLMQVNIAGLAALALFGALALFLWTHPNYVPPCAPGHRAHCPRIEGRGALPNAPPSPVVVDPHARR